ncbi:hypothetical protein OESDEN_04434 [Oesophagostomum dentatum]|uniref:Uncharacterized protein n=1 Tax=Oesophagostomum dentatum TaxID=61180 RepID=A0A0B1TDK4_OESDE|nr:hypothetical protein OESDEN_04434 [Oesophagostomum dentatum]
MEYQYWSPGDNYLDFAGPERNQGRFNNQPASGTPLVWSTNDPFALGYQKYNKYGKGFWLVELEMDCSRTENGWFELKASSEGFSKPWPGWENDVRQGACNGAIGGYAPFQSINHIAKCGAVNVFYWGSGGCTIDPV